MRYDIIRTSALLLVACIALSSCSGKGSESLKDAPAAGIAETGEHPTEMAAELLSGSYKAIDAELPEDIGDVSNIWELGSGEYVIYGTDWTQRGAPLEKLYIFSEDKNEYRRLEPEFPEEFLSADEHFPYTIFCADGKVYEVCYTQDHGGIVPPEEYDDSFDYESYEKNSRPGIMICAFDTNGKLLSKVIPDEIFRYKDDNGYTQISALLPDSDGYIAFVNDGTLIHISADGSVNELMGYEKCENGFISRSELLTDNAGAPYLYVIENDFDEGNYIIKLLPIDMTTGKLGAPLYSSEEEGFHESGRLTSGRGEYLIFMPEEDGLYGLRADGSRELVLNWADADITSGTAVPAGDDEFMVLSRNWNNNTSSLARLVRRDLSEVEETKVITLAALDSAVVSTSVNEFNRSQNDYRIKIVDYSQYNQPDDYTSDGAWEQLKMDIISGKAPDVIISSDHDDMMELAEKGAFADLYSLMEGDSEVNKDTLMPNIMKYGEGSDGSLYSLSPFFYAESIAVKSKFGVSENWTMKEMLDFYDSAPASADLIYKYDTKEAVFERYFDWTDSLIDSKKGTCDFDCDDFVRYLEFCNRFPDKEEEYEKYSDEWNNMQEEMWMKWPTDRDITERVWISIDHPLSFIKGFEAGEDITLAGYPSADGSGGRISCDTFVAISVSCPEKEGAWQYIRSNFTKRAQEKGYSCGFSARRDVFAGQVEDMKHFTDDNGDPVDHYESKGQKYYPLTDQEAEHFSEYIMNCCKSGGNYDKDVYAICLEEAQSYFAGERSAEEAAGMIQNRVAIVVSEKS